MLWILQFYGCFAVIGAMFVVVHGANGHGTVHHQKQKGWLCEVSFQLVIVGLVQQVCFIVVVCVVECLFKWTHHFFLFLFQFISHQPATLDVSSSFNVSMFYLVDCHLWLTWILLGHALFINDRKVSFPIMNLHLLIFTVLLNLMMVFSVFY